MDETFRKITLNVPEKILKNAMKITHLGITNTVIEGLAELEKRRKRSALRSLKGKIHFDLDLSRTRR